MIKLTRFTHACVYIEIGNTTFAIDPGEYGTIPDLAKLDAVLVTHDHFDHIHHQALREAHANNPDLKIFGPQAFKDAIGLPATAVDGGDVIDINGVRIEVVGHWQDVADLSDDPIPNVGYLIAGTVLHPGDSLQPLDVDVLLLPVATPWASSVGRQKALRAHPPRRIIPFHDVILNDLGVDFAIRTTQKLAQEIGAEVIVLPVGHSVEIAD